MENVFIHSETNISTNLAWYHFPMFTVETIVTLFKCVYENKVLYRKLIIDKVLVNFIHPRM